MSAPRRKEGPGSPGWTARPEPPWGVPPTSPCQIDAHRRPTAGPGPRWPSVTFAARPTAWSGPSPTRGWPSSATPPGTTSSSPGSSSTTRSAGRAPSGARPSRRWSARPSRSAGRSRTSSSTTSSTSAGSDGDEAGYYLHLLLTHGVEVLYVGENFSGDAADDLLRPVKQWQAREESKDLAKVTIRGMLSRVEGGYWNGGSPPFGYDLRYESPREDGGAFLFVLRFQADGSKLVLDEAGNTRVFAGHRRVPVWPVLSRGAHRGPLHTGDLTRVLGPKKRGPSPARAQSSLGSGSGGRIRTCDLRVMSPTSCLAAPPRDLGRRT